MTPAPDADGWIEWSGGECPVPGDTEVDTQQLSGDQVFGFVACLPIVGSWLWQDPNFGMNIVRYRISRDDI